MSNPSVFTETRCVYRLCAYSNVNTLYAGQGNWASIYGIVQDITVRTRDDYKIGINVYYMIIDLNDT